jgi:hypothetical protein
MSDLTQALADGLFNVLLVFETFLDMLDGILFLDSGISLLTFAYAGALLLFILDLFVGFVNPDDEKEPQEITDKISSNIDIGI